MRKGDATVAAGKAKFRSLFPRIDDRSKRGCLQLAAAHGHHEHWKLDIVGSIRSHPDAKPSTPQTAPEEVTRLPMHLTVGLDSLAAVLDSRQLGGESSLQFRYGAMFFNSFFQKPFMTAESFSWTRQYKSHGLHSRSNADDAAAAAAVALVQDISVAADSLVIGLSPSMNLSNSLVILTDQVTAFSRATKKGPPDANAASLPAYPPSNVSSTVASPCNGTIPGTISSDNLSAALNDSLSDEMLDGGGPFVSSSADGEVPRGKTLPLPLPLPSQQQQQQSFFVFSMQAQTLKVLVDAVYLAAYQTDFAAVEFEEFAFKLDCTKPDEQVRDSIRSLDPYFRLPDDKQLRHADVEARQREDMLAVLQHVDVSGGVLTLGSDIMAVKLLHDGEATVVELRDWGFFGPAYSCNIDYPLKPYMHSVVWIADNIYQHISDHGSRFEPSTTHFMTVVSKPEAPNKIYTDMILAGKSVRISYRPIDGPMIAAVNQTIAQCTPKFATAPRPAALTVTEQLPPAVQPTGPPLTAADQMRFAYHGKFSATFDRVSTVLVNSESNSLEQVKEVRVGFEHPRLFVASNNLVEWSSGLVSLEVEIKSMSLSHGPGNGSNRPSLQRARRTTVSSKGSSKASKIHSVLTLPAMVLSYGSVKDKVIKDFVADYGHHDVFIRPAHVQDVELVATQPSFNYLTQKYVLPSPKRFVRDDPFYLFRSRPMTSKMNLEIRLADNGADEPIILDLCLYYLLRITSFLSNTNSSKDEPTRPDAAAAAVSNGEQTSEVEAAHTIDVQIKIDRLVVCSWHSETNMKGIVFSLDSLELQMRFLRKLPVSADADAGIVTMAGTVPDFKDDSADAESARLHPLAIEHLFVDIQQPKLFIRDWNVSKRYASSFKEAGASSKVPRFHRFVPEVTATGARTVQDIMFMIKPSEIFSDAGTVEVSLTESGKVSAKNHSFHQSGKLLKLLEQPLHNAANASRPLTWAFFAESESALTQFPEFVLRRVGRPKEEGEEGGTGLETGGNLHLFVVGKQWEKLCALLSSNKSDHRHHHHHHNHPHRHQSALGLKDPRRSSQRWARKSQSQNQSRALSVIRDMQSKVRQFSHRIESMESMRMALPSESVDSESDYSDNSDAFVEEKADPFGNKMWGLRVIDCRILFTIKMRNILFGYIARCFDLFGAAKEDDKAAAAEKKAKQLPVFADSKRQNRGASVAEKTSTKFQLNSELLPLLEQARPVSPTRTTLSHMSFQPQQGLSAGHPSPSPTKDYNDLGNGKVSGDAQQPAQVRSDQLVAARDVHSSSADIHFFKVEFINLQVNFLDVNSHSSVIITAGRAGLDGHRSSTAAVSPMKSLDAQLAASPSMKAAAAQNNKYSDAALYASMSNRPMKRQEIQLNMEGVSAFTVLAFSENDAAAADEDEGDSIHWKPTGGKEEADLPYLKTAITDFHIQAKYMFWTEVPEEELAEMVVRQSEKELVAFFQLHLPYIRVDIESWQVSERLVVNRCLSIEGDVC